MTTPSQHSGLPPRSAAVAHLLAVYEAEMTHGSQAQAMAAIDAALADASAADWLDLAQRMVLRGLIAPAADVLTAARARHSRSAEIAFALAGLRLEHQLDTDAEVLLRDVLTLDPRHCAAALMLGRLLGRAGRTRASGDVLVAAFLGRRQPIDRVIQAMELLDEFDRKADASAIAEAEISGGCIDPRMHAYAASYAIQLGEFDLARARYLFAYEHSTQAPEWNVPFGLASTQRYRDANHPDFALLHACLERPDLSPPARTTLLFALGKAFDDVGDAARAVGYFRDANALAASLWPRSRKQWRRGIAARILAKPLAVRRERTGRFTPVFIVGIPRSGTTLTAELIARNPQVCNRGELTWMWKQSHRLPPSGQADRVLLDSIAAEYERQVRRDDADGIDWFIDKQPLNLLHVDLILALWPHAKIVYCQRSLRDIALSIWMQSFQDDTFAFAFDFPDIAAFQQGCVKLMEHWQTRYPSAIYALRYEELTGDPDGTVRDLSQWLGLPSAMSEIPASSIPAQAINTASVWQARQPVYRRSVGRWAGYAPLVPELLTFSANEH
ncbi:MAG: sulfotransferase [Dokdonella sp.]|uniref:tetratricopeptide repeat-containing sulfotransferase family protein n=1 Tax=Dokdonella sp. TaxID=2291710 RepID=UPI003265861E